MTLHMALFPCPLPFTVISSLTTQQSAIRMLSDRIQLVVSYISAVRQGTAVRDEEVLRSVKSILAQMPAMDSEEFRNEFLKVSAASRINAAYDRGMYV